MAELGGLTRDGQLNRGRARQSLGQAFDPRWNSLNLLRLALAVAVVLTHARQIANPGSEGIAHKTTIGTLAVYGFFGISGFLVAGSAERNRTGTYLWRRVIRIVPAFWICLLTTAFVFGVLGWLHSSASHPGCNWSCYFTQSNGAVGYVFHNALLRLNQLGISGTLTGSKLPNVWDGSLWTLFYEFLCYLILAVAALIGLFRRPWTIVVSTALMWIILATVTSVPTLNSQFNAFTGSTWHAILVLVPAFLAGASLYLCRGRVPDSGWIALLSISFFFLGFVLPLGNQTPAYTLTSTDITSIGIVYPLLWLGMHLPLQRIGRVNDYSYGVYIYAFPVQQLLAIWGIAAWGYWQYVGLTLLLTAPLAVASWWLVERNALKLKRLRLRRSVHELSEPLLVSD